jgi:uncharacterized membrane protein
MYSEKNMKRSADRRINLGAILPTLAWIVIVTGIALRFFWLDKYSLWSDELYTVSAALDVGKEVSRFSFVPKVIQQLNFDDSFLTWKAADNTPPLFELLLVIWAKLFGESDFALRALPATLGALSPVVFFYGLRRSVGNFAAMFGAALLAINPSAIAYSQEVRSYTLTLFLCTIALVRISNRILGSSLQKTKTGQDASLWIDVVLFLLMAYSHYTGLLVAGLFAVAHMMFISLPQKKYTDVLKFLLVPLLVLPWMMLSRKAFLFSSSGGYGWREYHLSEIFDMMMPGVLNFFLPGAGVLFAALSVLFLGAVITGYKSNDKWIFSFSDFSGKFLDRRVLLALYFLVVVAALFLYSVYNSFTSKMWHPRYFVAALPIVFCFLTLLFASSRLGNTFSALVALVLIGIALCGDYKYFSSEAYAKEEYRESSYYLSQNAKQGAVIVLGWEANEAFYRHYLDKDLPGGSGRYVIRSVSSMEDVKQLCSNELKEGRQIFMFQHQSQAPYFEELERCPGIKKVSARKFRGLLVEEFKY